MDCGIILQSNTIEHLQAYLSRKTARVLGILESAWLRYLVLIWSQNQPQLLRYSFNEMERSCNPQSDRRRRVILFDFNALNIQDDHQVWSESETENVETTDSPCHQDAFPAESSILSSLNNWQKNGSAREYGLDTGMCVYVARIWTWDCKSSRLARWTEILLSRWMQYIGRDSAGQVRRNSQSAKPLRTNHQHLVDS